MQNRIRELRKSSRLTQLSLQMKTGIEQALISKYETGERVPPTETLIRHAIEEFGLSARAYDRILRVARTIADLDGEEAISAVHLAEAIQYRNTDILKG